MPGNCFISALKLSTSQVSGKKRDSEKPRVSIVVRFVERHQRNGGCNYLKLLFSNLSILTFYEAIKFRGGSIKPAGVIAVNQSIMDNQTLCQQITWPFNHMSRKNLLAINRIFRKLYPLITCKTAEKSLSSQPLFLALI